MKIILNDKETEIAEGMSVGELAEANGAGQGGMAVAVNNRVVKRADWTETRLGEGDNVVLIKAAYGG